MHIKKVFRLLAFIIFFISSLMLIPMFISLFLGEIKAVLGFLISILSMCGFSLIVFLLTRKEDYNYFSQRDAFLFTTLTWILGTAFSALPLLYSGTFQDYSSCFFEIMSGFTTTGATCLSDIEGCFKGILFWRSMTNWLGGMGIVVLFVAFLPALGATGSTFSLMGAESVGPVKGKLTPKTKTTAIALWGIYIGFTLLETIFLLLGGLSLYDSITVSFSTLSAAGFCVKNQSIGSFNSVYVESVVTVFMIIGGANFSLYYKAFTGKIKNALQDSELKWYLSIILVLTLLGTIYLRLSGYYLNIFTAFRYMIFSVVSIITTTGFATTDYCLWPSFPIMLLILTMFIGGCAGSAGGGIKVTRIRTLCLSSYNSIKRRIHPSGIFYVRENGRALDTGTISSIKTFFGVYIISILLGTVVVSLTGIGLETCFSSVILSIGNIGIGFGQTGPAGNFVLFPLWSRWVFSFLMLCGRLELLTVYVLLAKSFWK